jgi:hypothetical protein
LRDLVSGPGDATGAGQGATASPGRHSGGAEAGWVYLYDTTSEL